ncbi:MAG: tRNA (cytidine(34)-2'-O)-methyltransferase [Planctomycetota bacterium]
MNTQPLHVVLYQPEIPPNTGNIGRTCVALGAKLWLVRPLGFDLSERQLRRAGLDYWVHLDWQVVDDWNSLTEQLDPSRFYFLSKHARRSVWDAQFAVGDVLVFGRETSGLPREILDPDDPRSLTLPMGPHVRSLNLATTAGIVMYEHYRQVGYDISLPSTAGSQSRGPQN